ncbi:MAG TPA: hypothetical protein VGF29_02910 [Hyphomicrobiaceae bacterium]|jgi:hypothetical protein
MTEDADRTDNALLLQVLNEVREELRHHRALLLESIDQGRSVERHVDVTLLAIGKQFEELKDDLELMIRSELMGLAGDFEPRRPRS